MSTKNDQRLHFFRWVCGCPPAAPCAALAYAVELMLAVERPGLVEWRAGASASRNTHQRGAVTL
jgi:hypothetical protein